MKERMVFLNLAIVMVFVSGIYGAAEEAKPEAKPEAKVEEKKPAMTLDEIKDLLGLSVYVQGGYTFNFVNPDSGSNEQRIFDKKANTFLLDLARIQFAKDPTVGGVGYKVKASFGEIAKYIHSAGLGNPNDAFDLTEAYLDYVAPLGNGLNLRFGKFVTFHGAEVIEAKDNFNYSRSFLFNYAIPFTHTGVLAGYKFSEALTANLYFVNGWDVSTDNNKGKTIGVGFAVTPFDPLQMNFNFMYGPELANNSSNNRFLFDWMGAIKATKKLTFMANLDYGREEKDPLNGDNNSKWYGVAGYAKYDFDDLFSAAIRAEYFNDKNGVRTGIAQELKEITLTADFRIAKNLILRPEYRHDWSTQNGFDSAHTALNTKSQDTIALGMMYTW